MVDGDEARALQERSPHNVAHIESFAGSGEARYAPAADALKRWEREGVLRRDATPAYYVYEQRFRVQGAKRTRRCFFARLRLHPPGDGVVRPHEATMPGPVADRLALLRATRTNTSPILAMFDDAGGEARALLARVAEAQPDFEATDRTGQRHRLWAVEDRRSVEVLTAAVQPSAVWIADGHHRYETALQFQAEQPSEATGWVLAGLIPLDDPGLVILPSHRLVRAPRLPERFLERLSVLYKADDITPRSWDGTAVQRLWGRVQASARGPVTFGVIGIEEQHLHVLTARSREAIDRAMPQTRSAAARALDVAVLTETILRPLLGIDEAALSAGERVDFTEDVEETWRQTERGRYRLAFLVNPVRVEQVTAVADAGELMPQKSTHFFPKLHTGMVLNPLD